MHTQTATCRRGRCSIACQQVLKLSFGAGLKGQRVVVPRMHDVAVHVPSRVPDEIGLGWHGFAHHACGRPCLPCSPFQCVDDVSPHRSN